METKSELPMHLMLAEYLPLGMKVNFLFYYPSSEHPEDWRKGLGAALEFINPVIYVPGDQDDPQYRISLADLPNYTEKLTGDRGVPCGIGVSKNEVQLVDYEGTEWMFYIQADSFTYHSGIQLSQFFHQ